MTARTFVRVSSDTAGDPFRTRDTVAAPTPARLATSAIVTFKRSLLRQPSRAVEPLPWWHKASTYVNGPLVPSSLPMHVEGLESVLSHEGWPYASAPPVEPGDPGRFHALFGRDSLITALQVLSERPDVAPPTQRALGALQGSRDDPATLEEPGKIGHEFRDAAPESFVASGWPA